VVAGRVGRLVGFFGGVASSTGGGATVGGGKAGGGSLGMGAVCTGGCSIGSAGAVFAAGAEGGAANAFLRHATPDAASRNTSGMMST
jgi:hypothetical protein